MGEFSKEIKSERASLRNRARTEGRLRQAVLSGDREDKGTRKQRLLGRQVSKDG